MLNYATGACALRTTRKIQKAVGAPPHSPSIFYIAATEPAGISPIRSQTPEIPPSTPPLLRKSHPYQDSLFQIPDRYSLHNSISFPTFFSRFSTTSASFPRMLDSKDFSPPERDKCLAGIPPTTIF